MRVGGGCRAGGHDSERGQDQRWWGCTVRGGLMEEFRLMFPMRMSISCARVRKSERVEGLPI